MPRPLAFLPPYSWIFWAVFLFAYLPEFRLVARSRPSPGENTDRGSTAVIVVATWISMTAAFVVSGAPSFLLVRGQKVWFVLGLTVLLLGAWLRRHCWRMLGLYFTGNVRVAAGQPVIEEGAYRWVRHPSYTGGMLMYLGTGLALSNWLSAVILTGMGAAGYAYRVRVEERALATTLGERYQDYMRRTKRFVPFVF
jgi:protein-S-isoprenylcysteine O-methyltransferase Ste14